MSKPVVDALIVIAYLMTVTAVGYYVSRKSRDTKEGYFVGGRKMAWPFIALSLFAAGISSMQLLGQAGLAYKIGIAAANPHLLGAIMMGFSAVFFVPLFIRSKIYTIPQILELRFGRPAQVFYSVTIVTMGIFASPFMFYAGGLAILEVLKLDPGYLWVCCLIVGFLVAAYTIVGGFTAVVLTDAIQGVIMVVGGIVVLVRGLIALPNLAVLNAAPRPQHLDLILPVSDPLMPWTGAFTGLLIASLFFAIVNHSILQKMLGARSVYDARMGMLVAGLLKIAAVFILVLPGVIAASLFPGINPDSAFPTMASRLLPVGLSGLVLAAFVAALMSSADSGVNAFAGIVSLNLYPLIRPRASDRESLLVGKITAGVLLAWSVGMAPFIGSFGLIFPLTLKISAFMLSPIGVCYLVGRFSRRVNQQGALSVMIIGYTLGIYFVVFTVFEPLHPLVPDFLLRTNFYHISPVLFLLYVLMIYLVSYATPPPDPKQVEAFMLSGNIHDDVKRPWYRSFGFWLGVLVCCFGLCYAVF